MSEHTVQAITHAARAQDWREVLSLLGDEGMQATRGDAVVLLAAADALCARGQLLDARDRYERLLDRDGVDRAAVWSGLGACYMEAGDAPSAARLLLRAAEGLRTHGPELQMRVAAQQGRLLARHNLVEAVDHLADAVTHGWPACAERADLRFWYAEALLRHGSFAQARLQLAIARADAEATDATKTVADVRLREASLAMLEPGRPHLGVAHEAITHARDLYRFLGDRGITFARLVEGQLALVQGAPALAESVARDVARAATHQPLLTAHAHLLAAEARRHMGRPAGADADAAEARYVQMRIGWGQYMVARHRAATDDGADTRLAELAGLHAAAIGAHELLTGVGDPVPLTFCQ